MAEQRTNRNKLGDFEFGFICGILTALVVSAVAMMIPI